MSKAYFGTILSLYLDRNEHNKLRVCLVDEDRQNFVLETK